tara:strand:+ start:444 stop:590 length:147 start_codon:yes stop_codon:yes gene_type:complete
MIIPEHIIKDIIMPRAKKKTVRRKKVVKEQNNFLIAVMNGAKKIFSPK